MGGYGSGRHGGRPTVEDGLTINLALLFRRGWVRDGAMGFPRLTWSCQGDTVATIQCFFDLTDADNAHLVLTYTRTPYDHRPPEKVEQRIHLTWTHPTYGGRRWWMHCPRTGRRVAKLHLPPGGDRFASRLAWRLPYRSQRSAHRDRPFDRLFRLQRKLGSDEGWEAGLRKPKGMWSRTYERHWDHYLQLDAQCGAEAMRMIGRL
jgi:hypothetical protein